jgi:hypothetical protein
MMLFLLSKTVVNHFAMSITILAAALNLHNTCHSLHIYASAKFNDQIADLAITARYLLSPSYGVAAVDLIIQQ